MTVIGEVNSSNSNIFDSNLTVEDYIALSGGFSPRANRDDLYIISANGSITPLMKSSFGLGLSRYELQKGDTIVVPIKATYSDNLSWWSEVTQVIYQSLVSLAALDSFGD